MTKKNQNIRKNKSRSRSKVSKSIKLVHAKRPVLRHLRLVEHKHTGKLLHFKHSSYVALLLILALVGFFLVVNQNFTNAMSPSVTIGAVVRAPPPAIGATITAPINGLRIVNLNPSQVSGECSSNSFVVVYNDGVLAGSTICSSVGNFSISIQLHSGQNTLTALNFDNINQAGPKTPPVIVTFVSEESTIEVTPPILPINPVLIPGITENMSDCNSYKPEGEFKTGGQPHVAVVCMPLTILANRDDKIGVFVWGGEPPYALSFKWGLNAGDSLISLDKPGYKTVNAHYASSGIYNINIQLVDSQSNFATGESATQVTGEHNQSFVQNVDGTNQFSWFETPVPLYITAVGVTFGFWGGDIFSRYFGSKLNNRKFSK